MSAFGLKVRSHFRVPAPAAEQTGDESVSSTGGASLATLAPQPHGRVGGPEQLLSTLWDEVAARIADLTNELAGDDPPGENFLEKAVG